jgi:transketolase
MPSRRELANAIRALSMDAVEKANSGHPGMPMGMADIAEVLWNDYLRHNPGNPKWIDRDRFILSNGHGAMLQYSLLHLTGYDLPMEQLKQFRQLHSKTPGHPEYGHTPGVETTTGPLGQGLANGVGMALAERVLGAQFNRDGHTIIDHFTYVFVGDGCLMAGTLGLGKLIVFYDDNGISIDGEVQGWFTDDTPKRFAAYNWHVVPNVDGHDPDSIRKAVEQARAEKRKPSLICCKTQIAYGSPNLAGSEKAHGAALGAAEVAATRENMGWKYEPFVIPDEIYDGWDARAKGKAREEEWRKKFAAYQSAHPTLAAEFERRVQSRLPVDWDKKATDFINAVAAKGEKVATRKASQNALNAYAPLLSEILGGSADLAESNNTIWKGSKPISKEETDGNYVHYGVREFGMTAMMNGMAVHGGFIPFGGTFLVFSDYARNAVRVAALMKAHTILVYTHDSIGLGEDGPTHQPVEHAASLRVMPNMVVWRPADAVETAVAWKAAIERHDGPTSLLLSRQALPHLARDDKTQANIQRGGYTLMDGNGVPEAIIIATGSEVSVAVEAAKHLAAQGRRIRVVSMPCIEVFAKQDAAYRESVLPRTVTKRVSVEAGATAIWARYVGFEGVSIGIDRFGESAPGPAVFEYLGITSKHVAETVAGLLA